MNLQSVTMFSFFHFKFGVRCGVKELETVIVKIPRPLPKSKKSSKELVEEQLIFIYSYFCHCIKQLEIKEHPWCLCKEFRIIYKAKSLFVKNDNNTWTNLSSFKVWRCFLKMSTTSMSSITHPCFKEGRPLVESLAIYCFH